jgi:uncharacterized damage-inducible protein DinB
MHLQPYATAMAAYNRWMNDRLYEHAAELTDEARKRDLGAFFRSLHGTLNHLLLGDQSWMQRFTGQPVTMTSPGQELHADFADLRRARRAMDEDIARWAEGLTDEIGAATLSFFSITYRRERSLPTWAAILHMFNHQTHHRGQATTLLKQLGQDPGVTDLPWMPFFDPPVR